MKKSYIILITIAVFGAGAIAFFPSQKEDQVSTATAEEPSTSTDAIDTIAAAQPSQPTVATQDTTNSSRMNDGTFTGSTESTPFGDLKISIVVSSGKISDVTFLAIPEDDAKSEQINARATPQLKSQTLAAQSVDIDGVSGATYTTEAYIDSLQAAIDAAKGA